MKSILKEPMIHFLLLAGLLFVMDLVVSGKRKDAIVVDRATADYLIGQRQDLELRKLTEDEKEDTIAAYIEDEILYREAYKRGLDKGDSRMRRNLILKMRGLLVGEVGEPTEEELQTYFTENRDEFSYPPTVSLEQVYFSDASTVPPGLLADLNAGLDPTTVGDSLGYPGRTRLKMTQAEQVGSFGPDAAKAILVIEDADWHGPIESNQGTHFFRILERTPAREAEYDDLKNYLPGSWMMEASRARIEAEIESLADDYEVVIEPKGNGEP